MKDESIVLKSVIGLKLSMKLFIFGCERFIDILLKELKTFEHPTNVLDIGCGTGGNIAYIKEKFNHKDCRFYGIDPSSQMIKKAREKYKGISYWLRGAEEIPFNDNTMDIVMSSFTFHHVSLEYKKRAIEEINRVLCPGGIFLYADFGRPDTFWTRIIMNLFAKVFPFWYEHIPSQMNNEVIDMLRDAGFVVEIIAKKTVINGRVYCIIAHKEE